MLKKLTRRLKGLELRPLNKAAKAAKPNAKTETHDAKVRKRAEQIRARWKDIPTVSSVFGTDATIETTATAEETPDAAEPTARK